MVKLSACLYQFLVALAALLALTVATVVQGRSGLRTTLFVLQVLQSPVKPQSWFTPRPVREVVQYPIAVGYAEAHVYRPADGRPRAAVVLALGVAPLGFEDPDAVNVGEALARAGVVVMFHWSPSMGQRTRLEPEEIANIVSAFEFLESCPYVDPRRVALGGFCVGASFAIVAAADARIRDRVIVIYAFGPYYDAGTLVLEAASREVNSKGQKIKWEPDALTSKLLANEFINLLEVPREADLLARKYLNGEHISADEMGGLSTEAREVMGLLDGVGPEQARAIYDRLPERFHRGIDRVSPARHISGLRGRLLVMHDRDDEVVPAAESRRLVEAAEGLVDVRYTEFVAFDHVTPRDEGMAGLLRQGLRLYRHMRDVLSIAY